MPVITSLHAAAEGVSGAKGEVGGRREPPRDLNDFPPAGEAGGKNPKFPKITTVTTTTAGL